MNITEVWDTLTAVNSADSFVMNGADAIPNEGDTIAFFGRRFGDFLAPPGSNPLVRRICRHGGGQPITVQLKLPLSWLKPGMHANQYESRAFPEFMFRTWISTTNSVGAFCWEGSISWCRDRLSGI